MRGATSQLQQVAHILCSVEVLLPSLVQGPLALAPLALLPLKAWSWGWLQDLSSYRSERHGVALLWRLTLQGSVMLSSQQLPAVFGWPLLQEGGSLPALHLQ